MCINDITREFCFLVVSIGLFAILFVKFLRANGECLGIWSRRRTYKSAISLGELIIELWSEDFRMGKPRQALWVTWWLPPEYIGRVEGTGGSETSQYPQEEKTIVIPLVVASEPGSG
jgi:hypothetical protein